MKTRSSIALLLAAGAMLFTAACTDSDHIINPVPAVVYGDGNVVEESRTIGACSSLDHGGVGRVYIEQGGREQLRVRAEENLIDYLNTEVRAGELVIWKDGVTLLNTRPIEYDLTVVDLDRVALTGAGSIHASNLDTGPLALKLSGAGNVEFVDLNAPRLDVDTSGVGDVILSGSVQEQTIRLRGMGNYDGRDLTSAVADVLIAYGGSATVRVQEHLTVTINGSGTVYYIGDPIVDSTINGSGAVVKIGG
jgi:hypothetical protein